MARLAKKAKSANSSSITKTKPVISQKERAPGLKASILSRELNEFLHAPKQTKKEKKQEREAKLLEKVAATATTTTTSSLSSGRVSKTTANKKSEKQRLKRQKQAAQFQGSLNGLLDSLPTSQELLELEQKRREKKKIKDLSVKTREAIIRHDVEAFKQNIVVTESQDAAAQASPVSRLSLLKERVAASLKKQNVLKESAKNKDEENVMET